MRYNNNRMLNYMSFFFIVILFSIFIPSNFVIASSTTILKGNSAVKDNKTNMVYYKNGVVDSTGGVNLVRKDKKKGTTKTVTKVDEKPFYIKDNYIYYTYNKDIYRIKTDGTSKGQLYKSNKSYRLQIIGMDKTYVYYADIVKSDTYVLNIGRIKIDGTQNTIIKKLSYANTDVFATPVLYHNKIYYINKSSSSNYEKSLMSITLDGKTTKTVEKLAYNISNLCSNAYGLFYNVEKDKEYLIQKVDEDGKKITLVTLEKDNYSYVYDVALSVNDNSYLYYAVNSDIHRINYDGEEDEFIYNTDELRYKGDIRELYVRGDWMIFLTDSDEYRYYYCVKVDGSYSVCLSNHVFSHSFDILSDTIYYHVVTIPNDDEHSVYDETVYRKFTLPLKEYD